MIWGRVGCATYATCDLWVHTCISTCKLPNYRLLIEKSTSLPTIFPGSDQITLSFHLVFPIRNWGWAGCQLETPTVCSISQVRYQENTCQAMAFFPAESPYPHPHPSNVGKNTVEISVSIHHSLQPIPSPGPVGGCWPFSPQLPTGKLCRGPAPRCWYLAPGRRENMGPVTASGGGACPAGLPWPCHPLLRRRM